MKIGIIGKGVVGNAVFWGLQAIGHKLSYYDKKEEQSTINDIIDTEIVFICVPTNSHPAAPAFFKNFEEVYTSFKIFDHYDWSDCGGFELAQEATGKEFFNDVTKNDPPAINPLPLSLYDEYFEHWMGWTNKEARADLSGTKEKEKILKRLKKER